MVVVGLAVTTVSQAGDKKSDKDKLQGKWQAVAMTAMGVELPKETFKGEKSLVLTFEGDKVFATEGGKKEEATAFTLDETKKPRRMTVAKTAKEPEMKTIYLLEGDTLKVGMFGAEPSKDWPTTFDSKELVVMTFKRIKK